MPISPVSLGSGSDKSRFSVGGAARFVNAYVEQQGQNAKAPTLVVASDGLIEAGTVATAVARAMIEVGSYLYAVYGNTFYQIDIYSNSIALGTVPTTGPVYMVRNRRAAPHIGIVSDGNYYVYDTAAGTFTHVVNNSSGVLIADLQPLSIAILDGYGVLSCKNSVWYITALDDLKSIDSLDFAKAESNPDETVRVATREGDLVLFGARSIEWWQDTGGVDFPFTRSQAIELGCLAGGSVANVDRTLCWIAHDGTVRVMQGYDGKTVSNHAVERAILAVDPATIRAMTWWNNGHTFYCISSDVWTWVYDLSTGYWHERTSGALARWRIATVARFGLNIYCGDAYTGDFYQMAATAYDDAGTEMVMTVQTPPVHAFPYRLRFNAAMIDIIPGVGLPTLDRQNSEPDLMLQWSDNGGETWSLEQRVSLGKQGTTTRRGIVRRLGTSSPHGRTFKLSISAAVAKGLLGMSVDADKLGV